MNRQLKTITLDNELGMVVELNNYVAGISSTILLVNGKPQEMTFSYDNPNEI